MKRLTLFFFTLLFTIGLKAQIDIVCPAETDLGTYDCSTIQNVPDIPNNVEEASAAPYNLIINNPTPSTRVDSDDTGVIFYCATDARSVTRTVRVYEDTDFNFAYTEGEPNETCTYTISTIEDTTPPVFVAPPLANLPCDVDIEDLSITGAVVEISDNNCPVNSISEYAFYADAVVTGGCPNVLVITRSWTAVDPCGNTSEPQTQVINLIDSEGPQFTAPADITLECGADITDLSLTGDVTDESDACDEASNIEANYVDTETIEQNDGCNQLTIVTRRWGAVDGCGNPTTKEQTITIVCEAEVPACNTDPCVGDVQELGADGCSCETVQARVAGCTDNTACNFNPEANCDDGSCRATPGDCNTDICLGDVEQLSADGCSCEVVEPQVLGCTDDTACNYESSANCDDDSCVPVPICNTDPCLGDVTELVGSDACECSLVEQQVLGCTDPTSFSYNPAANCDDDSCIYGDNCSYTQGFWGNKGGKKDGLTTAEMIDIALEGAGGSITIGAEGQSLTVSSAKCVLSLLPSKSGSRALKEGDEVYEGNCSQNKQNRINNRLAGETLVLSLNTLTSPGLNSVVLCDPANCLVDRVPDSVCEALGEGGTIADLLVLANETIGGIYEVTDRNFYSDVNEAINVISERYNDCKNPCGEPRIKLDNLNKQISSITVQPNPANGFLNIEFALEEQTENVKLEIYQLNGQRVIEKEFIGYKGEQTKHIDIMSISQGIYMLSLNINGKIHTQKFIKENM